MKQSLEGLVNNVKNAMGDRDTGAWGWTLGEWLKHTVKLEQRVEELEAENTTLTETKPTEPGWYWFMINDKSPETMWLSTSMVVHVIEWKLHDSRLCAMFPHRRRLVDEMGGLWSEKLEEPR